MKVAEFNGPYPRASSNIQHVLNIIPDRGAIEFSVKSQLESVVLEVESILFNLVSRLAYSYGNPRANSQEHSAKVRSRGLGKALLVLSPYS